MHARPVAVPLLLFVCSLFLAAGSKAQTPPQRNPVPVSSRVDLFGGYAYFHPYDGEIGGSAYQPINPGAVTSLSGYFNRYFGVQVEGGFHPDGPNDCVYTGQGGPVLRLPRWRWVPFAHVLGGGAKIGGPAFQPCTWGWGVTAGLGLDYVLPRFSNRLALRIIQADWQYSHVSYGPLAAGGVAGGEVDLKDYRLASGIVLRFGSTEPTLPVQASCSIKPQTVFVGDPVAVSLEAANLNPKKKVSYSWASTGGVVSGSGDSVTVDTRDLAAGTYTVSGTVMEGDKPKQKATCSSAFAVRTFDPPSIACVANPDRVKPGEPSTITANGISPQNRPLTYFFSADVGQVSNPTGNQAILSSNGIPIGNVTVTCKVVDDLRQTASATATVTLIPPPPPPPPPTRDLCTISFVRDRKRPARVDNEAKGCLDDIAQALIGDQDARLEIVAHSDAADKPEAAAQRAVSTKQYLTQEKGIDPSRIELRTGVATGRTVDSILVPAGASFSSEGTTVVDESSVKPPSPTKGSMRH